MRVTEITPTHCSSCFAQKNGEVHVDFDAAWDGPVFNEAEEHEQPRFVAIDELVICESCLREAGALIQLKPAERIEREKVVLEERVRELSERLAGAVEHIGRLEEAQASGERLVARLAPPAPGRDGSAGARRRKSAAGAQADEKAAA
jgi:hypothetical protein